MTTAKIASSFSATLGNGFISQFLPPHRGHTFPYFLALMAFTVLILAFAQRASGIDTRIWRRLGVSNLALAQRASKTSSTLTTFHAVSILALAQRASNTVTSNHDTQMFQFSPSHRGHPKDGNNLLDTIVVSILALAQRASFSKKTVCTGSVVSILALAQRASKNPTCPTLPVCCFNSRPRTEGIYPQMATANSFSRFNSRPRTEGILILEVDAYSSQSFNSRPRTEGIRRLRHMQR